jgi:hypothetical protein
MAMTPNLDLLLNQCEPGHRVLMFMVPTRIIRVLECTPNTFRVEQLLHKDWVTLSTHCDPAEAYGSSLYAAVNAAVAAQEKLKAKIRERMGCKTEISRA